MSKNKNSTHKKTQEEKSREFSKAVEEKSREIAEKEQRRKEFSRAVEEKNREFSKKSGNTAKAVQDANEKKSADNAKKQSDGEPEGAELVKATLSRAAAVKYIIIIAVVGGVSLAGIVMCALNIMRSNWFFAADYLIAALLGISIVIVKVNTLFPTFVACDGKNLVMRSYDNNVAPYNISHKVSFLCDFIPAKLKTTRMRASEIDSIIIGTKNYIKRHCGEDSAFLEEIEKIENSNIGKNMLLGMDMIYFADKNGQSAFMSVDKFDTESIADVVRVCMKASPDVQILCNNKYLRNKILFDLPSK